MRRFENSPFQDTLRKIFAVRQIAGLIEQGQLKEQDIIDIFYATMINENHDDSERARSQNIYPLKFVAAVIVSCFTYTNAEVFRRGFDGQQFCDILTEVIQDTDPGVPLNVTDKLTAFVGRITETIQNDQASGYRAPLQ